MAATGLSAGLLIRVLNHLLLREPWAMARLAPFSSKVAQISAPPIDFLFSLAPDGTLLALDGTEAPPSVSVVLPPDALIKGLSGDFPAILSAARISGSADFAEALSFVFKNLRWDVEADLSAMVGEIPAWRAMRAIRQGLSWQRKTQLNLLANLKEYLVEESQQVLSEQEILEFSVSVSELRDDLARLEKRLAKL